MNNLYTTEALTQIRMQERVAEATASRHVSAATAPGKSRISRFVAAIRVLGDVDDVRDAMDLDFVPSLSDYPARARAH